MTHQFDDDTDYEIDYGVREKPRRRIWLTIVVVIGLAASGVGSAILWRSYGGPPPAAATALAAAKGSTPAEAADKPVGSRDFQAFQQQVAGSAQSTAQLLAAQQAEIKRLSDQVAALSGKIDALQRPAVSAQAAVPAPPPAAPRKKPATKPAAGISTGGAPLPPPVQLSR